MNWIIGLMALVMIITLPSCSKPVDDQQPTAALVVDLQQSAITINDIDSADVVFRKTGTNEIIRQPFEKKAGQLVAALQSLTTGTWNADIELYTKAVNRQSNQFVIIKSILIAEQAADIQIAGPGPTSGNGWLKRNVKASAGNEVVVIVPDEVYDSYFEFRTNTQQSLVFGIQREAININYLLKMKTWACNNTCFDAKGRIADINHFMLFTQVIQSSPWTKSEISISVLNNQNEELLEYQRTWNQ
jgi:hypothetical protein